MDNSMKTLSSFVFSVMVLTLVWGSPASAQTDFTPSGAAVKADREVDLHVPAADEIQRLTLSDGSQVFGQVESIGTDSIVFRSIAGP